MSSHPSVTICSKDDDVSPLPAWATSGAISTHVTLGRLTGRRSKEQSSRQRGVFDRGGGYECRTAIARTHGDLLRRLNETSTPTRRLRSAFSCAKMERFFGWKPTYSWAPTSTLRGTVPATRLWRSQSRVGDLPVESGTRTRHPSGSEIPHICLGPRHGLRADDHRFAI